jgi:hypothetical protein
MVPWLEEEPAVAMAVVVVVIFADRRLFMDRLQVPATTTVAVQALVWLLVLQRSHVVRNTNIVEKAMDTAKAGSGIINMIMLDRQPIKKKIVVVRGKASVL